MRKSITVIALASLAVLVVAASAAAADPFGWRASGRTTHDNGGYGWYDNGAGYANWNPVATAVPMSSQPAATQPATTPQPTARPSATSVPTRHHAEVRSSTGTRMMEGPSTQHQDHHGSDWCDDHGRDDHGAVWH